MEIFNETNFNFNNPKLAELCKSVADDIIANPNITNPNILNKRIDAIIESCHTKEDIEQAKIFLGTCTMQSIALFEYLSIKMIKLDEKMAISEKQDIATFLSDIRHDIAPIDLPSNIINEKNNNIEFKINELSKRFELYKSNSNPTIKDIVSIIDDANSLKENLDLNTNKLPEETKTKMSSILRGILTFMVYKKSITDEISEKYKEITQGLNSMHSPETYDSKQLESINNTAVEIEELINELRKGTYLSEYPEMEAKMNRVYNAIQKYQITNEEINSIKGL